MLTTMLRAPVLELPAISAYLDGLVDAARQTEVRALLGRDQARLFDAVADYLPLTEEFFVPKEVSAMTPVTHVGKNSLALFTTFEKVFYQSGTGSPRAIAGYNRAGGFVETVVGPGYFTLTGGPREGELLIDYTTLPKDHPSGTPPILPNSARLSRVVYNGTQDIMRRVSDHVSIGRAMRNGAVMDNWFVLCRAVGRVPSP